MNEDPRFKSVKESATILTELMIPAYANFGGKVHGGILLSLMDKVAYVCASKHAGSYCVTVAVDGVEFLTPVEVGELVSLKASVNFVGNSSMIVGIRVECLKPETGIIKHSNSCYFTMAARDDKGLARIVPGLLLENKEEIRRFCEGMKLRFLSGQRRKLMLSDLAHLNDAEKEEMCAGQRCRIISEPSI
jgi:acyl-CoA hydrolase